MQVKFAKFHVNPGLPVKHYACILERRASCNACEKFIPIEMARSFSHDGMVKVLFTFLKGGAISVPHRKNTGTEMYRHHLLREKPGESGGYLRIFLPRRARHVGYCEMLMLC